MNWVDKLSARTWSILVICTLAFAISGCDGDTGPAGATGATGPEGPEGPPGVTPDDNAAAIAKADVESCGTCHGGAGDMHYAEYAPYTEASVFELIIDDVGNEDFGGGDFGLTIDFSITHFGAPFIDPLGMPPSVESSSWYVVKYDSTTDLFSNAGGYFPSLNAGQAVSNGDGTYTLRQIVAYDIFAFESGAIVGKIADGLLDIEDKQYNPSAGKRVQMFANTSTASYEVGNMDTFESVANVEGCQACHGTPYRKHGNIEAVIDGSADFLQCKACHSDDRSGGHEDWQYMVDDPFNWATDVPIVDDGRYDYQARLVNDTHMSHAMEFPYPQSMANCNTCHEGKLDLVLADDNFELAFCKSCHVVQGVDAWPDEIYGQGHRPPPMTYLWAESTVPTLHNADMDCQTCHGEAGFSTFADMHSGYDDHIYDEDGNKFADLYTAQVTGVTMSGNLMTIAFTSNNVDVIPEVLVSLYGWDTKNFIVGSHERDANEACTGRHPGCKMEYVPISSGGSANPLFTENAGSVPGNWSITLDLAAFQAVKTDPLPTLIADGVVKKAEISITPELEIDGQDVVLLATGETFDIGGMMFVDNYFKGLNKTVDVDKCNACHDSLASTFHDGSGRGGDGVEVCKHCHTTTFPGSHVEMASRAIDSYVHAIHTFQPFDEDDVAADDDPVFTARNDQHKSHVFPNLTALSCEGCHMEGTYNAPDQSKSLFGVQSASYDIPGRAIGTVYESVTGPTSRACGGCHRANMIIEDEAGNLATFDAHVDSFGTFEENDVDDEIVYGVIDKIMSMFE